MSRVEPVIGRLVGQLDQANPGDVLGVYLFGSSAVGGLRPDSDIDVLVLTRRSLSASERRELVAFLLRFSGRRATVTPGRPLELTSLVLGDVVPWTYPAVCGFLYGEWLRDEYVDRVPERHVNPDLAVLLTTAQQHAVCLRGPAPGALLSPVPRQDLHGSIHDSLPALMADLVGDERNVLLTLARMVLTIETGRIAPKDEAVEWVLPDLGEPHRSVLSLAAGGYRGDLDDDWTERQDAARDTAEHLVTRILDIPVSGHSSANHDGNRPQVVLPWAHGHDRRSTGRAHDPTAHA
jgi:predicted nucleotidyltransferase